MTSTTTPLDPVSVPSLHDRASALFGRHVREVGPHRWDLPTPCADWDVRALVGPVVAEDLWTPPLVAGATIEDVGTRFDGDVLGADPVAAAEAASDEAVLAVAGAGSL